MISLVKAKGFSESLLWPNGGAPVVRGIKTTLGASTVSVVGNRLDTLGTSSKRKQFGSFDESG